MCVFRFGIRIEKTASHYEMSLETILKNQLYILLLWEKLSVSTWGQPTPA